MNEINEGIRLNHYEDKKFKTNTINVFLRTKLTREDATKTALLADTLKLGCRKYPTQKEINIQLEKLMGSVFDISIVKKGGEQIIYFYMEVLTGESNFNQAMDIVREVLYRPLVEREKFNSEIVVKAKTRLKEELKSQKDSKAMYALDRMAEELSKNIEGENFGIPPLGYLEEVDKINEHCLFEHYNKIITSAPIDIYVVGKEKADTVVNCCRNAFNNTRYNIKELPLMPFKQTNNTVKEIRENLGTNQGKLCVCYSTAKEQTKENIVTLLVLNEILGGGANS
ncbi:MAG: insulinase family protein, partial [Anaerotignaceae bacterium]